MTPSVLVAEEEAAPEWRSGAIATTGGARTRRIGAGGPAPSRPRGRGDPPTSSGGSGTRLQIVSPPWASPSRRDRPPISSSAAVSRVAPGSPVYFASRRTAGLASRSTPQDGALARDEPADAGLLVDERLEHASTGCLGPGVGDRRQANVRSARRSPAPSVLPDQADGAVRGDGERGARPVRARRRTRGRPARRPSGARGHRADATSGRTRSRFPPGFRCTTAPSTVRTSPQLHAVAQLLGVLAEHEVGGERDREEGEPAVGGPDAPCRSSAPRDGHGDSRRPRAGDRDPRSTSPVSGRKHTTSGDSPTAHASWPVLVDARGGGGAPRRARLPGHRDARRPARAETAASTVATRKTRMPITATMTSIPPTADRRRRRAHRRRARSARWSSARSRGGSGPSRAGSSRDDGARRGLGRVRRTSGIRGRSGGGAVGRGERREARAPERLRPGTPARRA